MGPAFKKRFKFSSKQGSSFKNAANLRSTIRVDLHSTFRIFFSESMGRQLLNEQPGSHPLFCFSILLLMVHRSWSDNLVLDSLTMVRLEDTVQTTINCCARISCHAAVAHGVSLLCSC